MNKPILFLLVLVIVSACETVSAQIPTYAPYGAWRGRIRYVQGPFRTRSTIHWGNGITPTGGQVLMTGMTTAGNVLTNPDFLDKITSLRDAEADKAGNEISTTVNRIRAINADLRKNLNETVLSKVGLDPSPLELSDNSSLTTDPGPPQDGSVEDLHARVAANVRELGNLANEIRSGAPEAVLYGEFLQSNIENLGLNEEQVESLVKLTAFARVVFTATDAEDSSQTEFGTPVVALEQFLVKLHDLSKNCARAKEMSSQLQGSSKKLLDIVELPSVRRAVEFAEHVSKIAAKWGEPPSIPKTMFENIGDPTTSEGGSSVESPGTALAEPNDPFAPDPPGATPEDIGPGINPSAPSVQPSSDLPKASGDANDGTE